MSPPTVREVSINQILTYLGEVTILVQYRLQNNCTSHQGKVTKQFCISVTLMQKVLKSQTFPI